MIESYPTIKVRWFGASRKFRRMGIRYYLGFFWWVVFLALIFFHPPLPPQWDTGVHEFLTLYSGELVSCCFPHDFSFSVDVINTSDSRCTQEPSGVFVNG